MKNSITFRIHLNHIAPEIWRTFTVDQEEDFFSLHQIIQIVMGWENAHLFEFKFNDRRIGLLPDEDELWEVDESVEDSESITISDLGLNVGNKLEYVYDFSDTWVHTLEVIDFKAESLDVPVCLDGSRNCPPEDCGGPQGYIDLLNVIKDPKSPEYGETIEWLGDDFDPEWFDQKEVNELLEEFVDWRDSMESDDFDDF